MVEAIRIEAARRLTYLQGTVDTIYFGGGTPSLLSPAQIESLLATLYQHFQISEAPEITLEANPDDIHEEKIKAYHAAGINRISIGIQTFHGPHLIFLHRAHDEQMALRAVKMVQDAGIENITIDLMYALPTPDHTIWAQDLQRALELGVPHISAYCLTIEEKTTFGHWVKRKKLQPIDEDFAAVQFEMLTEALGSAGYEHYEISNFALPGYYSRHNTSYWNQVPYLGLGPGAHSFDLYSRQFNIPNNAMYLKGRLSGEFPYDKEILTLADRVNEYLLTSLRTQWGCSLSKIDDMGFVGFASLKAHALEKAKKMELLFEKERTLYLTQKGKLLADSITTDLMIELE
jgi:oxygen-independent coproporphyrinogen-3 oxidase